MRGSKKKIIANNWWLIQQVNLIFPIKFAGPKGRKYQISIVLDMPLRWFLPLFMWNPEEPLEPTPAQKCQAWAVSTVRLASYINDIEACPCNVVKASYDTRFSYYITKLGQAMCFVSINVRGGPDGLYVTNVRNFKLIKVEIHSK